MEERPLLDKLGVKPGMRVSVLRVDAPWFLELLRERGADLSLRRRRGSDLVILGAETAAQLGDVAGIEPYLRRDGAVWVITRKGSKEANQNHAMRAGLDAGLVDNKIAAFSDTHSAIRLVIPVARR
ncbi:MAG: hypothetical protein HY658_03565 [Actinobacteria bacterium]|nr:hypothetical protein [Actinomycetota bacterium]